MPEPKTIDHSKKIAEKIDSLEKTMSSFYSLCDERNGLLVGIEQKLGDIAFQLAIIADRITDTDKEE